ncbi:MAG: transcription elongation factor GreA [Eubacterium sp.]|nr:transcription elongation factor GreA [Eubacterium sp.]
MLKHELTAQDIKKMEEEIEYRQVVLRKELLGHVKEARAHGDLSENFEYHAAKKEKNRNESRIRYLEKMIRNAKVIEDHSDQDQVGLNKTVTLFFEEDNEEEKFSVVTTVLADSTKNRVSIESPLGKAIMGHRKGDRVYIEVKPDFGYYVEIRDVEPFLEDVPLNRY